MGRILIRRRENGTWNPVRGTEAPLDGDFTLNFVDAFNDTRVEEIFSGIRSIEAKRLGPIYPENSKWGWFRVSYCLVGFGLLALILFAVFAWFLYFYHEEHPFRSFLLVAAWTIAVPIYFFIEHEYIFFYKGDAFQYDQFKRVQDLAAKIWAGAIAVLGAIVALKLYH